MKHEGLAGRRKASNTYANYNKYYAEKASIGPDFARSKGRIRISKTKPHYQAILLHAEAQRFRKSENGNSGHSSLGAFLLCGFA